MVDEPKPEKKLFGIKLPDWVTNASKKVSGAMDTTKAKEAMERAAKMTQDKAKQARDMASKSASQMSAKASEMGAKASDMAKKAESAASSAIKKDKPEDKLEDKPT